MEISHFQFLSGAKQATGLTVIIDVFRACTSQAYAFAGGIKRLFPVSQISEAHHLKTLFPHALTIGERGGIRIEGFDLGNSPSKLSTVDLHDKILIHTTQSGTQGLTFALGADEVITGSFVNATAVAKYILSQNPKHLSIVAMGTAEGVPCKEDTLFASYLEDLLRQKTPMETSKMVDLMRQADGQKFFYPDLQDSLPEADFEFCTRFNHFDFVLRLKTGEDGIKELEKIIP